MLNALFARSDHPVGYGYPDGRAHGYSIVIVVCADTDELKKVREYLINHKFPISRDPEAWGNTWYGGRFDYIGTVEGEFVGNSYWPEQPKKNDHYSEKGAVNINSYGDNRFFGVYLASYLLGDN